MARVYKPAVNASSLRKQLSNTVYKGGTGRRFSEKTFQKQMQKSSNPILRKHLGFTTKGKIQKNVALRAAEEFYKEANENSAFKVDELAMKKAGIKYEEGKITSIGKQKIYQTITEDEYKAEQPTGPSPKEIAKEKKRKEAQAMLNKWRRAREIDQEEKKKKESHASTPRKPDQAPQAPLEEPTDNNQPGIQIPTMAHGLGGVTQQVPRSDSVQEPIQEPIDADDINPLVAQALDETLGDSASRDAAAADDPVTTEDTRTEPDDSQSRDDTPEGEEK